MIVVYLGGRKLVSRLYIVKTVRVGKIKDLLLVIVMPLFIVLSYVLIHFVEHSKISYATNSTIFRGQCDDSGPKRCLSFAKSIKNLLPFFNICIYVKFIVFLPTFERLFLTH